MSTMRVLPNCYHDWGGTSGVNNAKTRAKPWLVHDYIWDDPLLEDTGGLSREYVLRIPACRKRRLKVRLG